MYPLSRTAGTPGAHRKASPPTAATIAPSEKAMKSMTVVRRRRASTFVRRARAAAASSEGVRRGTGTRLRAGGALSDARAGFAHLLTNLFALRFTNLFAYLFLPCGRLCLCLDRRLRLWPGRRHGEGPDVHRIGDRSRVQGAGLPSSVERARRSLAYRRSIPARPDSNRMAVLKRSVGRASFSSSCLRSHIGTK